jgi:hypothetical protein
MSRGRVDVLESFNTTLEALAALGAGTLILESWDEGLLIRTGLAGADALIEVKRLGEKHGCPVRFSFFNPVDEVRWDGDLGRRLTVLGEGAPPAGEALYEVEAIAVRLNTNIGRFPGLAALQGRGTGSAQVFRQGSRTLYLKLKDLDPMGGKTSPGGGDHA